VTAEKDINKKIQNGKEMTIGKLRRNLVPIIPVLSQQIEIIERN
jgi:hypothetical protein